MSKGFDGLWQEMSEGLRAVNDEVKLTRTELRILAQKYGEHEVSIEAMKRAR